MRRILRWLWEEHGAQKLDGHVPRAMAPRPRNVTANREQIEDMVTNAPDDLRLFILLCSDAAIRAGTAVRIGAENYDPTTKALQFKTKMDGCVSIPATKELADLMDTCDMADRDPFITQLRKRINPRCKNQMQGTVVKAQQMDAEFKKLRIKLHIDKRIVPHDLRRTTAVAYYKRTHDLRKVQGLLGHRSMQSTIWYLDHDIHDISELDLEAIKRPFIVRKERTA